MELRFRVLVPVLAGALAACNGDLELSNGARVEVSEDTPLVLEVDGRRLFAFAAGASPTVATWDETASGELAIWDFERTGEQLAPLHTFAGAERDGDRVVVRWTGDGEAAATLTVSGGEAHTVFELEVAGSADSIRLPVACDPGGSFHGFGEQYDATEHSGEAFTLMVSEQGIGRDGSTRILTGDAHTTYFPMPYWLDARGFGVLFETDYRVEVDLCATDPEVAWIEATSGEPLRWRVFHGPTPLDVIRQLGAVVGRPARPPSWAFRPWIGVQGGREAVLAEADALNAAGIPYAALWAQDWTGPRQNLGGGWGVQYRWEADESHYPDLAGLVDLLHGRGVRFLAYANPFVDPELPNHFDAMAAGGLLIRDPASGEPYVHLAPNLRSSHPDLTHADARAYVRDALTNMVTTWGIDGWMADFGEWLPLDTWYADESDPRATHNRYPVLWHRMNREAMEAARPDGDWVTFARSGWTGVQAYSQIHWVGDQEATFSPTDGLPTVVPAMLSLGLSGVPYVTHDIAGFSGGPSTRELFQRWTELGAFTPVMRTHEGNAREANWSWERDGETTAHFRRFARIHEALAPELEALADAAQETSAPLVRHLMLGFPDDPEARAVHDQFLLGPDLLVAPVVTEGTTTRPVYLPAGSWYHVFTGERFEGGRRVEVAAPVGTPPVFSRGRDRPDLRAID